MFRNIEKSEPQPAPVEEPRSSEVDESMLLAEDDLYDNMPCTD